MPTGGVGIARRAARCDRPLNAREVCVGHRESVKIRVILNPTAGYMFTSSASAFISFNIFYTYDSANKVE